MFQENSIETCKPAFSISSFTFLKRLFWSSSLSAIRVVSSAYLMLLIFLLAILILACAFSSLAFQMMYSSYKLNKQSDNIQPCRIPFPIWNQCIVPCLVLTVASWPAYRFIRRQVRWSGILISWRLFHSLLWSTQSNALSQTMKHMIFLEFSCFFYNPVDAGNLICGSSAFSKSSLNIWKFSVHVLLKPSLENFEHYFASVWDECSCTVVWTFFGITFLWDWNENWYFPVLWPLPIFQICWLIECYTFTSSYLRIWNSSTGILSPPLVLFVVMLPKANLISHFRMSCSRWVITPLWLSGSLRSFLYSSSM